MIMFILAMALSVIAVTALLYQKGRFAQNGGIFMVLQGYVILLSGMQITQSPPEYHFVGYSLFLLTLLITFLKNRYYDLARLTLALLLVIAPLSLIFPY